jgi:hypothetical protein
MVMQHFASSGGASSAEGQLGGVAQQLLGKFL